MVAQREQQYKTIDEWRELERTTPDAKYEYIDGQVYLMSEGSLAHSRISSNTLRALEDALAKNGRSIYSDQTMRLSLRVWISGFLWPPSIEGQQCRRC